MRRADSHSYEALSSPLCCKISYSSADGRGADVQRLDPAAQRQRDQLVAALRHARAQAAPPRCRARARRPPPRSRGGRRAPARAAVALGARAVAPAARLARVAQEVREVAHARDRQVLDGARRGLADGRRDLRGAALGDHDAGRAGALGGAADRAEVLRVLDLVERDEQRVGPARAARRRRVGVGARVGADPLMGARAAARARSPRRSPMRDARPASHGSRAAPAVAQISPTACLRRPRSASRTGLRP